MSSKRLDSRLVGGILLIVGTCIGAGMLALPVTNGPAGFVDSTLFVFLCWAITTLGALLILEINLWLPPGNNIISMAKATLGKPAQILAWVAYLLLLYALISAYLSAASDILQGLLVLFRIHLPLWSATTILTIVMAAIVYRGIRSIDLINRGLISAKFITYFILVLSITPYVSLSNLQGGEAKYITGILMVLITSFGFSIIVPSLRSYFDHDAKKLRLAIIIGSIIPLCFYIIWNAVIIGVVPREDELGLIALLNSNNPNSGLALALQNTLDNNWITSFFRFFASVCILTSFLGVSLCLFDFLADGLQLQKRGNQGLLILIIAFLPPYIIMLFYPSIFIIALSYAGLICVILLLLLPTLMTWSGRYIKKIASGYQVFGGKTTLIIMAITSSILMVVGIKY